jgi:hypothetical protein
MKPVSLEKIAGVTGGEYRGPQELRSALIANVVKDNREATLRVSNDLGSETQRITLTQQTDSTWLMRFEGRNVVKRVNGKKLVKIPSSFLMRKDVK